MSSRIKSMRRALYDELKRLNTPGTWEHIINQIGMFSYTGLTKDQVRILLQKYHIYILDSGRISISGCKLLSPFILSVPLGQSHRFLYSYLHHHDSETHHAMRYPLPPSPSNVTHVLLPARQVPSGKDSVLPIPGTQPVSKS